ncbi:MAG: hypothetical protein SCARUB_01073 [Candidatus Scalindua rubra]|uniref:DUF4268 domain-containing protein n=1 Tax=Candidatus Scalindua rubra TaxID=1872076 RepID=A0A1E3XFU9_9BACT|nr:MAG: hypothetical protein SCARUB_01073 [Candidatus Scalindua rubra]
MSNNNFELGQLVQVDLRHIWTNESEQFTPWLAKEENLKLLGDTIGIELELEAQEKNVGPFRADILCKDTASDHWVLIENQLEKTDHIHLGQLLTYAAGLKAVTIVWISRRFTEEHRAALDWLNEITDNHFNFFGLEVELWRIGNSPVAPKFNIISKPNDWSKTVAVGASQVKTTALTDSKLLQRDFWTGFCEYVKEQGSKIKTTKPLPQHWMNIAIGRSGIGLAAVASLFDTVAESFSSHELRTELVLDDNNSKNYFAQLEAEKEEIESKIGEQLTWYNPPEKRMCRIYIRKSTNLQDKSKWSEQHAWLLEKLELFYDVFSNRVKKLEIK